MLFSHCDISLTIRHKHDLLELITSNDHLIVALPSANKHIGIERITLRNGLSFSFFLV